MKKLLLTSAAVIFVGLTAFMYGRTIKEYGTENIKKETRKEIWSEEVFLLLDEPTGNLNYSLQGRYKRPVTQTALQEAKLLGDFISGYPASWISDYISVEIMSRCDGKSLKAVSTNDMLTAEQKNILQAATLAADIIINVEYKSQNSMTGNFENSKMHVAMTVVPEIEAEYIGGKQEMTKYLKENVINKISAATPKEFQQGIVIFTINEKGE